MSRADAYWIESEFVKFMCFMAATIESLCMIVRNEEKCSRCLEVCGCMDKIIIVDTGSSDGTKESRAFYG